MQNYSFQHISLHDSWHGLTILQQSVQIDFAECQQYAIEHDGRMGLFYYSEAEHCSEIQKYTNKMNKECPVQN